MSSREFAEWMAYDQIAPFGDERADLRSAIIAATVANALRGEQQQSYAVRDFLPSFAAPKAEASQSWEEQLQMVELLNAAFGGKDERVA